VTALSEDRPRQPTELPTLIFQALFSIVPTIPESTRDAVARAAARLEYGLSRTRRDAVLSNLACIAEAGHPALLDPRERDRIARSIFESYHRFLMEYFAQKALDARALDERFRFRGMELLYRALSEGRGAVICAPHLGNWELAGLALARLGFLVHVVTGIQFGDRFTRAVRAIKERQRILVSTPRDGFTPLLQSLRRGGVVVLLTDGDVFGRSLTAEFFGRPIPIPAGPALLTRRARAPLLHAHAERDRSGRHMISFDGVECFDPSLRLDADLRRITRRVAEAQERAIATHVGQWCIFRRVFEEADAA
jgi:KDO2-lipid IV(A) lauroyltransferase